jgi:homoserine/homoserine lactone efflux protein
MSLELYFAFMAMAAVLILIPGPNVALIVASSVAHGWRYGLLMVAGTSSAMFIQLTLTVFGLTAALSVMAGWFEWLRWGGVAYLVYLGMKAWCAPLVDLTTAKAQACSAPSIYLRGFLISLTNPKTLLFFGAFVPQFISPDAEPIGQLVLLSATFLIIAMLFDGTWALTADRFRRLESPPLVILCSVISGIRIPGAAAWFWSSAWF